MGCASSGSANAEKPGAKSKEKDGFVATQPVVMVGNGAQVYGFNTPGEPKIEPKSPRLSAKSPRGSVDRSMVSQASHVTNLTTIDADTKVKVGATYAGVGLLPELEVVYFEALGRCDPLIQLFEHHSQPYRKVSLTQADWATKKSAEQGGEFGCLPTVSYTDTRGKVINMAQTSAMLRSFGIRFGYYSTNNWEQARLVDPIVETWPDVLRGAVRIHQAEALEKEMLEEAYVNGICTKFHNLCEKNLIFHGERFIAGDQVTIADFVLCSYVANILTNPSSPVSADSQAILDQTPHFKTYTQTVLAEFAKHLNSRPTPPPF